MAVLAVPRDAEPVLRALPVLYGQHLHAADQPGLFHQPCKCQWAKRLGLFPNGFRFQPPLWVYSLWTASGPVVHRTLSCRVSTGLRRLPCRVSIDWGLGSRGVLCPRRARGARAARTLSTSLPVRDSGAVPAFVRGVIRRSGLRYQHLSSSQSKLEYSHSGLSGHQGWHS